MTDRKVIERIKEAFNKYAVTFNNGVTIVNTRRADLLFNDAIDHFGFRRVPYSKDLCIGAWDCERFSTRKTTNDNIIKIKKRCFEPTAYANEILDTIEECAKEKGLTLIIIGDKNVAHAFPGRVFIPCIDELSKQNYPHINFTDHAMSSDVFDSF